MSRKEQSFCWHSRRREELSTKNPSVAKIWSIASRRCVDLREEAKLQALAIVASQHVCVCVLFLVACDVLSKVWLDCFILATVHAFDFPCGWFNHRGSDENESELALAGVMFT